MGEQRYLHGNFQTDEAPSDVCSAPELLLGCREGLRHSKNRPVQTSSRYGPISIVFKCLTQINQILWPRTRTMILTRGLLPSRTILAQV